jgi:hypothetical protein
MSRSRRANPQRTPKTRHTPTPARRASEGAFEGEGDNTSRIGKNSSLRSRRAGELAIEAGETALHFKNRCGATYYLQEGKTRTGKPKYYAGRKLTGAPLAALPEGHEFYERPDTAQVVIRKIQPSPITELERRQAEEIINRASGLEYCIVAIEGDALVVYTPSTTRADADRLIELVGGGFFGLRSAQADLLREAQFRHSQFTKMLRFTLVDPDNRAYRAERWCFRGSIDDWIDLPGYGSLKKLIEKYAKHLGKDSFYDLM